MNDGSDINSALAGLRPILVKVAMLQLRNAVWAEDVVSETLVAAFEQSPRFEARSKLSTWAIGILKHKIIDQLRRQGREASIDARLDDEAAGDLDDLYQPDGSQAAAPSDWGDPEHALRQQQFMEMLQSCVACLPDKQGRAFMMREWLDMDTGEICRSLGITASHCNVMLFRARMRLRQCVEQKWFADHAGAGLKGAGQGAVMASA
jgi:RNA polymerase sigma-70 factor (TIGR02943 family)